jgi:hypothetical protein
MSTCSTFKDCCNVNEKFWVENPKFLFCTLNPYPKGNINSIKRLNAITRLILYISLLFYLFKYKYWHIFLFLGIFFVILLYYITNNKDNNTMEHFKFTSPVNSNTYLDNPLSLYTNTRSDMTANITNSTQGSTDDLIKKQSGYSNTAVKRDIEAGIQYFSPNVGTNPRVVVPPVIGPRITDSEVWGKSMIVRPRTNFLKTRDITETDMQLADAAGNSSCLGVPIFYTPQVPGSILPQNRLNQPTYDGYYPSEQNDVLGGMDERDFAATVLPTYHNPPVLESPPELANKIPIPGYPFTDEDDNPLDSMDDNIYSNTEIKLTEKKPDEMTALDAKKEYNTLIQKEEKRNKIDENKKEKFEYLTSNTNNKMNNQQIQNLNNNLQSFQLSQRGSLNPLNTSEPNYALSNKFYNQGNIEAPSQYYNMMNRVPPGQNIQPKTVMSQMVPQSPTYVYTDKYFEQPDKRLFLQDIQPKLYSYTVDQQPINSNIGITYSPQMPPPVLDQITDNGLSRPIMTRVDPQLVRTDGTRAQQALSPQRTNWSAEYSNFVPPPGSINFEDIYDPRFTSYGDPYRSYSDINLGQVQYYYSDVDAYRMPNFATRSNVDFIEYRTPQGQIWPEYQRTSGVDDVRPYVEDQYTADDTFHREDLMSLQMNKANRIAWSQRFAPLRQRGANTHASTFGPGI